MGHFTAIIDMSVTLPQHETQSTPFRHGEQELHRIVHPELMSYQTKELLRLLRWFQPILHPTITTF